MNPQETPRREPYSTQRLEAFSDGVFAIAITLLILDVRVPRDLPETTRLIDALLANWPSYFAFLTSFATIGIMWVNHHRLFGCIARADHGLLIWNGLLLLGITFVPFPTALIAEYIGHPDERTPRWSSAAHMSSWRSCLMACGGMRPGGVVCWENRSTRPA